MLLFSSRRQLGAADGAISEMILFQMSSPSLRSAPTRRAIGARPRPQWTAQPPPPLESRLMTRECCNKILPLLNANAPTLSGKRQREGRHFLSAEGRILSVIIQSDKAIMKDIPLVTGISFRSCYEIISKLSALGVIEKRAHSSDRRAIRLAVNQPKLCKHFCRRPPSE